jgi:hypothetical protein
MATRRQKRLALAEQAKPEKEESRVTPMRSDAARKKAATGELGASGTILTGGMLRTESNAKLLHTLAYGNPGSPAWGEWQKLIRTDSAVATALNKVVAPLRDSRFEVEPAKVEKPKKAKAKPVEEKPVLGAETEPSEEAGELDEEGEGEGESGEEERNQVIADYVSDCFNKWLTPTMGMHIEQVVKGGLGYGFSLHEPVFAVREDDRVEGGQAYYIRKMAQRLPNSVMQNGWIEKDGELSVIRQQGYVDGKWVTAELPADRVQLATWDRDGNNYAGFSAFRSVWYVGLLRAEMLRIIGIGHQREACGVPVASMDKEVRLTDDERDELQELLETVVFHENAGFQLPPGVTVDWFFSPGANKGNVLETWRQLGIAILQVVGAEDSELGMGEAGTRSLGETKAAARNGFIEGVRAWLEGVFNGIGEWPYTGIVRKLVDVNFGPQKEYPKLKLVTPKADMGIKEMADATAVLVQAGIVRPTREDENTFRERLGLDLVDEAPVTTMPAPTVAFGPDGKPLPVNPKAKSAEGAPQPGVVPSPVVGGAPAAMGAEKAQDTALNGAQVASAMSIVVAVAKGELPRDSGIAMLQSFFNITPEDAEKIMGTVGAGFEPKEPEPPPMPFGGGMTPPPKDEKPDDEKTNAKARMLAELMGEE